MSSENDSTPDDGRENEVPPIPVPSPEQSAAVPPTATPPDPHPVTAPGAGYTAADGTAPPPPPPFTPGVPPAYQAAPAYGAVPPVYAQPGPPQGLSIASMVTGIGGLVLSFFGIGLLASIAAVITGHLAVKRQPYAKGLWLTGLITGYVGIFFAAVATVIIVVFIVIGLAASTSGAYYENS